MRGIILVLLLFVLGIFLIGCDNEVNEEECVFDYNFNSFIDTECAKLKLEDYFYDCSDLDNNSFWSVRCSESSKKICGVQCSLGFLIKEDSFAETSICYSKNNLTEAVDRCVNYIWSAVPNITIKYPKEYEKEK